MIRANYELCSLFTVKTHNYLTMIHHKLVHKFITSHAHTQLFVCVCIKTEK